MTAALHVALGLHPLFIDQNHDQSMNQLEQQLEKDTKVVAIGEIGLDYRSNTIERATQQQLFQQQLALADQYQRPLLLHILKAHQDATQILKAHHHHGGIVHAFSGSYEQAKHYIDQGFLLGIGGVASRPDAHKLHRVIQQVPLSALALETDAPDLPPIWAQGSRNSPLQIPRIAAVIAELRGEPVATIATETTANVSTLLSLPH